MKANEKKVYDLIVRRFLSAFGESAHRVETIINIKVEDEQFIAKGTITVDKGWYVYYGKHMKPKEIKMPDTKKGEVVNVKEIIKHEKETEPPRRYSPASIIKELENRNLGTKSTRAHIIDTLYQRDFIRGTRLEATVVGMSVIKTLSNYSPQIVDEELTRSFEDEMQEIREDKKTKNEVLEKAKDILTNILSDFKKNEKKIGEELVEAQRETTEKESLGACPNCDDGTLLIKRGKFGRFVACDKYPDCKTTYNIPNAGFIEPSGHNCKECKVPTILIKFKGRKKEENCMNPKCPSRQVEEEAEERECPKCKKGTMKLRSSMYGQFYGCSNYPKCKHTEKIAKKQKSEISELGNEKISKKEDKKEDKKE